MSAGSHAPAVVAHRTCPRHEHENSIAGIRRAAALGADAVEIDVRVSRDGVPLLVHDRTLWSYLRLPGPAHAYDASLLTGRPRRDSGEPIATFAEALDSLPPGLVMAVDVKESEAAPAVLAEVRRQRARKRVLFWAKSMDALHFFAHEEPGVERALLRDTWTIRGARKLLADALHCGAHAISARWGTVTAKFVAAAHHKGLRVYSMATDARSQHVKLGHGLDGIVTDWPEEALAAVRDVRRGGGFAGRELARG